MSESMDMNAALQIATANMQDGKPYMDGLEAPDQRIPLECEIERTLRTFFRIESDSASGAARLAAEHAERSLNAFLARECVKAIAVHVLLDAPGLRELFRPD